jgi:hypothetical protein
MEIQVLGQVRSLVAGVLQQQLGHLGYGTVEGEGLGIHLGAVARRHDDGLGDILPAAQRVEQGCPPVGVQAEELQRLHVGVVMRKSR